MPPVDPDSRPWEMVGRLGRRRFLKLMAQSMALLGLSGCARLTSPREALPYVHAPADVVPGERNFYATVFNSGGYARGLIAECVMGRPVKVDGHPDHPSTLGGSDAAMQAMLLELYDPDRVRDVEYQGKPSSLSALQDFLRKQGAELSENEGRGLHIVTPWHEAPSFEELVASHFPRAVVHTVDPFSSTQKVRTHYNLENADLVLSLGADPLGEHPDRVRLAHDFASRREPNNMSRWVVLEPGLSLTGVSADLRKTMGMLQLSELLDRLLHESPADQWETKLLADLQARPGRSLVMGAHYLDQQKIHQLNLRLGNLKETVSYSKLRKPSQPLRESLNQGKVKLLLSLYCDPVYLSGGDLPVDRAEHSVQLHHRDCLSAHTMQWSVPALHPMEYWGDLRSYQGTTSVVQPAVEPLTEGVSAHHLVAMLAGDRRTDYEIVKGFWEGKGLDWRQVLSTGTADDTAWPGTVFEPPEPTPVPADSVLYVRPDPYFGDGGSTNNPWLMELARPITRLAWNNAVVVNQDWARQQGLDEGDLVKLETAFGQVLAPIYPASYQAPGVFEVNAGWGQKYAGRFSSGVGFDVYPLCGPQSERVLTVKVSPAHEKVDLISESPHHRMEGRDPVKQVPLAAWDSSLDAEEPDKSLYPPMENTKRRWGMVIDLSKCIGCNACVAACGAENNLPVVGPEQTARGRAMHWLRVDHYDQPRPAFQPVPCMHCEDAPCEQVCPVEATLHNKEGLNQMVYNRCVGTRYCSNNCPYKVRRFNFLDFTNPDIDEWDMVRNPEVTVRSRGVMEKCSYCVQRIEAADIRSRIEERPIRDGEVITACQAACPTKAIVFGDLQDEQSEVARLAAMPHNYALMAELGTRPRTTYLAQIKNNEDQPS